MIAVNDHLFYDYLRVAMTLRGGPFVGVIRSPEQWHFSEPGLPSPVIIAHSFAMFAKAFPTNLLAQAVQEIRETKNTHLGGVRYYVEEGALNVVAGRDFLPKMLFAHIAAAAVGLVVLRELVERAGDVITSGTLELLVGDSRSEVTGLPPVPPEAFERDYSKPDLGPTSSVFGMDDVDAVWDEIASFDAAKGVFPCVGSTRYVRRVLAPLATLAKTRDLSMVDRISDPYIRESLRIRVRREN